MGGDDDPVPTAPVGMFVVILRRQLAHGRRQLSGERGSVGGRRESDLHVDRQRGERLAGLISPSGEVGDFADHASGNSDEVPGREPVGPGRVGRLRAED
jgi:hypothetical protein